jgi:hypothetical protein
MTEPAPAPPPLPAPASSWPAVFVGRGALVVSCALDPAALADKIPGLTWVAFKVGGTDVADDTETSHCRAVWQSRGLQVGAWVDCQGPPHADVRTFAPWQPLPFVVYDVESAYKADEGGPYEWARQLTVEHERRWPGLPAAVTSYGGYKTSIDFASLMQAGWPILAQVYDSFKDGDEQTYRKVYPPQAIHRLTRRLQLHAGEAVYRPESVD